MLVEDFFYDLPAELIAQTPLAQRDSSRLLVLEKATGALEHRHFYEVLEYLGEKDLLVFNDSKVIPARLQGSKETGAKIEVFLLRRLSETEWEVLVKPGRKVPPDTRLVFSPHLSCDVLAKTDFGGRIVRFFYEGVFEELLASLGEIPLPPYIQSELTDFSRYQTVYAKHDGSVAAPTAGLHFTPEILQSLKEKGVQSAFVTLHVGLGTFRPVTSDTIEGHQMHKEYFTVSEQAARAINKTKAAGGRIVAVGTTSVRVLESMAQGGMLQAGAGETAIFIYPGYQFQLVDALITNFHLPKSTLLMLVSALAGKEKIFQSYQSAIQERYRFFSFGDAMFIY